MSSKNAHVPLWLHYVTYCYIILYTLAAVLVSLHRFWQYEVFYYDFGLFDQAIWNVAHGKAPIIDHLVMGGKLIFADHLSPSLFLLSPLYWFTHRQEILLIAQALAVGASALVIYTVARKMLHGSWLGFCTIVSYTLFVGLQNALIYDIHEVTFATLPLAFPPGVTMTTSSITSGEPAMPQLMFVALLSARMLTDQTALPVAAARHFRIPAAPRAYSLPS